MGQILSEAEEADAGQTQLQVKDRYSIGSTKLGEGSYGTVWQAIDRQTGSVVAVKKLSKAKLNGTGVIAHKCIDREVTMMRACRHDNIGRMHGAFEDPLYFYLVMEMCEGGDLNDIVNRRNWHSVSDHCKVEWSYQMCSAVAALHRKRICHRDIKPSNYMLTRDSKIKLSDFGLAVFLPEGSVLSDRVGTYAFMAPEIYTSRTQGYSFPADAWAVGLCIYMLIFQGNHPFVDSRGQLIESSLLAGHLSFGEETSFSGLLRSLTMIIGEEEPEDSFCSQNEVRHCISSLVDIDDSARMTAASAARSPWIAQRRKRSATTPRPQQASRQGSGTLEVSERPSFTKASRQGSSTLEVSESPSFTKASRQGSRTLEVAKRPTFTKASRQGSSMLEVSESPSFTKASRQDTRLLEVSGSPSFTKASQSPLPNLLQSSHSHSKKVYRSPSKELGFVSPLKTRANFKDEYPTTKLVAGKVPAACTPSFVYYVRV